MTLGRCLTKLFACLILPLLPIEAMASQHTYIPHCIPISSVPYGAPPQIPPPPLSSFNTSPFINHHDFLVFPAAEIQCSTPPTVILTTPL
uniref:Uncharacterized protein n=1 Tax=Populus trichocarpa TaxID=3694 RepID=A0A2K1YDJ9_POPTR